MSVVPDGSMQVLETKVFISIAVYCNRSFLYKVSSTSEWLHPCLLYVSVAVNVLAN